MSISVLDICAYVGLVAVAAIAFNMVLGMPMAVRYIAGSTIFNCTTGPGMWL